MTSILHLTFALLLAATTMAHGKELSCSPEAAMGETLCDVHFYQRGSELQILDGSRIDFDQLTVTSADGLESKLKKLDANVYKSANLPIYFITNESRSIVTEIAVDESGACAKVLLCK